MAETFKHEITEKVLRQCTPGKAACDSPWLDVHPDVIQMLKDDGIEVERIGQPAHSIGLNSRYQATTIRISVTPLVAHFRKLVGEKEFERRTAAQQATAASSNLQTESVKPASRASA